MGEFFGHSIRENTRAPARPPTSDGGQSAIDRVLTALSDDRCRYVLYCLTESQPAEFDELVNGVVAWEREVAATRVSDDIERGVRTSLYHRQLPKMADLDIIEYDQRSGAVCYRDPPPHLEEFVELARKLESI